MKMKIQADGSVTYIYTEIINADEIGQITAIRRASHVEPTHDNQWIADLSPVSGPTLGPFSLRSEALKAEVAWLEDNML